MIRSPNSPDGDNSFGDNSPLLPSLSPSTRRQIRGSARPLPAGAEDMTYFTAREVASILRISHDKVLTVIKRGKLEAVNVAAASSKRPQFRIRKSALERFVSDHSSSPEPREVPPQRRATRSPSNQAMRDYFGNSDTN